MPTFLLRLAIFIWARLQSFLPEDPAGTSSSCCQCLPLNCIVSLQLGIGAAHDIYCICLLQIRSPAHRPTEGVHTAGCCQVQNIGGLRLSACNRSAVTGRIFSKKKKNVAKDSQNYLLLQIALVKAGSSHKKRCNWAQIKVANRRRKVGIVGNQDCWYLVLAFQL